MTQPATGAKRRETVAAHVDDFHPLRRIAVKMGGRYRVLDAEEIDVIEASGNNVRLHTDSGIHVLRESLSRLERVLDPQVFERVHRSAIVNIHRIHEITSNSHGDCMLKMIGGRVVAMSRAHRHRLKGRFGPEF